MWTMYAAVWRMIDGETHIDSDQIETETLGSLVWECQAYMDNRDGLFIFWPDPANHPVSLEHYAERIGSDIPFGRDQTITGHFATWVRHDRIIVRPLYGLKRSERFRDHP